MINDNKELSESTKNLFLSGAYKKLVSDAFDEWYAEKISILIIKVESDVVCVIE